MKFLLLLASLFIFSQARADYIYFTHPCTDSYSPDDSTFYCDGGGITNDLAWTRIWRYYVTGGGYQLVDSLDARGKECLPDSAQVDQGPGAHYYVQEVDLSGNPACVSNDVYIPGYVTGVPLEPKGAQVVQTIWYGINGRIPDPFPKTNGIFWRVQVYSDGHKSVSKKIVILR